MGNVNHPRKQRLAEKGSLLIVTVFLWLLLNTMPTIAEELTVQEWVDQFVASCVGSGSSDLASGEVAANGEISLKKLALGGTVKGQVQITHKDARLLSDGINNAMSAVAADQADKVRQCMSPIRLILVEVMQSQFRLNTRSGGPVYILTPEEDAIIRVLVNSTKRFGNTSSAASIDTIFSQTHFSNIKFNATMRRLQDKFYAMQTTELDIGSNQIVTVPVVVLMPSGEEYALKAGLAR